MLNNTGQYYHLCLPHIGGRDMQPLAEKLHGSGFNHVAGRKTFKAELSTL